MSARTDLAQTIGRALRTEGFPYASAALCYAVADAIAERPGLLRAVIDAENVNDPATLAETER